MKPAIAAAIALLLPVLALGQPSKVTFKAVPDRTRLAVGERFWLTVTLDGIDVENHGPFDLPDVSSHLRLLDTSYRNQQYMVSVTGGRPSFSTTIETKYLFEAVQVGVLEFPAISYLVGKKTMSSQPFKIEILAPTTSGEREASDAWVPPTDPYIDPQLPKQEAYVGEQIMVSWYLYHDQPFYEPRIDLYKQSGDFTSTQLATATNLNPSRKLIGDREWLVAFLHSKALFPNRAGDLKIETIRMSFVRRGRRGILTDTVESPSVTIKVKPLPEEGKPDDFTGAVGQFQIKLSETKARLQANQQLRFTLTITGSGHPDFIPKPQIEMPPGFGLYTEDAERDVHQEQGQAVCMRSFKFIIVPNVAGEFELGPFHFSYFDPQDGKYKVAQSDQLKLTVTPGAETGPAPIVAEPAATLTAANNPRFIKLGVPRPLARGGWVLGARTSLVAQLSPLAILGVAFGLKKRRERLSTDQGYARRRRAARDAIKTLARAARAERDGDDFEAAAIAHRAFTAYVADRFNLPAQGMTTADALEAMRAGGAADAEIEAGRGLLESLDMVRFAPGAGSARGGAQTIQLVRDLIKNLEKGPGG